MPSVTVNGVRLFYALAGDGPSLVLVHGSWGDGTGWDPELPALTQRFRVLTCDRRGHSRSERPPTQGSAEEDTADLAAQIEHLAPAPTHGQLRLRVRAIHDPIHGRGRRSNTLCKNRSFQLEAFP